MPELREIARSLEAQIQRSELSSLFHCFRAYFFSNFSGITSSTIMTRISMMILSFAYISHTYPLYLIDA